MVRNAKRPLVSIDFAFFLIGITFAEASRSMTMVQVPVFLRELGADIQQVGLFFTLSLIFPLLLRIFGGWLSDTIGHLRAISIGSLAGCLAYISYALTSSWQMALLGPALLSVATSLIAPSYRAHIAKTTDKEILGRVFGISETVRKIAWILGPPLGGLLAQSFGYRWMFAAAMLSYAIAAVIFIFLTLRLSKVSSQPAEKPSMESFRGSLQETMVLVLSGGLITWLLITLGVYDIGEKMSFDLMPLYLNDIANLGKQEIGLLDGLHGIAWVAAGLSGGWLVDKTSERTGIAFGLFILITSRLIFAFAFSFWGFAFSWILMGISGALMQPAINSLVVKGVPTRLVGITFAFLATSQGLISLPFPWIGSRIWNIFSPKAPFLITVFLGSLAIVPAWYKLVVPATKPPVEEPEAPPSN